MITEIKNLWCTLLSGQVETSFQEKIELSCDRYDFNSCSGKLYNLKSTCNQVEEEIIKITDAYNQMMIWTCKVTMQSTWQNYRCGGVVVRPYDSHAIDMWFIP